MAILSGLLLASKARGLASFFVRNWQAVLIIALLAAGGFYHMSRTNQINTLEQTIGAKNEEISELKLDLASCNGAINNQNEIIDTLKVTGKQIIQEERVRAAKKIAAIEAKRKADLVALKSKPLAESCTAAIKELLDFAIGDTK